jgi:hypothetical protein
VALFSANPLALRSVTACVCVEPMDLRCADGGTSDCTDIGLNDRLTAAVPNGLTYSGLQSPDGALLAMAFFEPRVVAPTCASLGDGGADLCDQANLVACAGLAAPIGGQTYDITCASCQDSVHDSFGPNTGPCFTEGSECFLESCSDALFGTIDGGL